MPIKVIRETFSKGKLSIVIRGSSNYASLETAEGTEDLQYVNGETTLTTSARPGKGYRVFGDQKRAIADGICPRE